MLQARSHLLGTWRSEDGAGNASSEQALTYKASESGFMARTTPTDDSNVARLRERRGIAIDDFIGCVEKERWVGKGERVKGRKDGMAGICKVVLCC